MLSIGLVVSINPPSIGIMNPLDKNPLGNPTSNVLAAPNRPESFAITLCVCVVPVLGCPTMNTGSSRTRVFRHPNAHSAPSPIAPSALNTDSVVTSARRGAKRTKSIDARWRQSVSIHRQRVTPDMGWFLACHHGPETRQSIVAADIGRATRARASDASPAREILHNVPRCSIRASELSRDWSNWRDSCARRARAHDIDARASPSSHARARARGADANDERR